ncbi:hypothetical protein OESDEN_25251 [Oesophagostomum dentatum]|uniref:Uncharacterized protein n=1 Tax=Oesophagostomum dentatum TaxID=61180 RepID=A0A0B1RQ32_OESDE|nr:hypothetical protein OESDEN_25251 [Oesophagostomum dentatum]
MQHDQRSPLRYNQKNLPRIQRIHDAPSGHFNFIRLFLFHDLPHQVLKKNSQYGV